MVDCDAELARAFTPDPSPNGRGEYIAEVGPQREKWLVDNADDVPIDKRTFSDLRFRWHNKRLAVLPAQQAIGSIVIDKRFGIGVDRE